MLYWGSLQACFRQDWVWPRCMDLTNGFLRTKKGSQQNLSAKGLKDNPHVELSSESSGVEVEHCALRQNLAFGHRPSAQWPFNYHRKSATSKRHFSLVKPVDLQLRLPVMWKNELGSASYRNEYRRVQRTILPLLMYMLGLVRTSSTT
jgi:hypothetical protein